MKIYVASKRKDVDLEKTIHNMNEYQLRVFAYGIARGWEFDETISIAENIPVQSKESEDE